MPAAHGLVERRVPDAVGAVQVEHRLHDPGLAGHHPRGLRPVFLERLRHLRARTALAEIDVLNREQPPAVQILPRVEPPQPVRVDLPRPQRVACRDGVRREITGRHEDHPSFRTGRFVRQADLVEHPVAVDLAIDEHTRAIDHTIEVRPRRLALVDKPAAPNLGQRRLGTGRGSEHDDADERPFQHALVTAPSPGTSGSGGGGRPASARGRAPSIAPPSRSAGARRASRRPTP